MRAKNLFFLLLIVLCILLTIWLFFPGYVDNDAADQLQQGRSGNFNDWHPPIMSWVWGGVDRIVPGAAGMLIFHSILYWGGLGIFIGFAARNPLRRGLYLLFGFYPPAFMLLGSIVKDVAMATALLFGFALILLSGKKRSIALFACGMLFLGYGMLIRHNAIAAVFPLFLVSGSILAGIHSARSGRRTTLWSSLLFGLILFTGMFAAGRLANNALTKTKLYPYQQIMLHDLVGISLRTRTYLVPEYLAASEQPSMKDLRRVYQLGSMKNLYWPDFTRIHFKIISDPLLVRDLVGVWGRTVYEHPRAYLQHRWGVFKAAMNIRRGQTCAPYYYEETIYKPQGVVQGGGNYYSDKPATDLLFTRMEPLRNSFIYWNWLYLLAPLALAAVSLFFILQYGAAEKPLAVVALAFGASGALYGLGYLFAASACDFRFVYWNVISILAASILLLNSAGKTRAADAGMKS